MNIRGYNVDMHVFLLRGYLSHVTIFRKKKKCELMLSQILFYTHKYIVVYIKDGEIPLMLQLEPISLLA